MQLQHSVKHTQHFLVIFVYKYSNEEMVNDLNMKLTYRIYQQRVKKTLSQYTLYLDLSLYFTDIEDQYVNNKDCNFYRIIEYYNAYINIILTRTCKMHARCIKFAINSNGFVYVTRELKSYGKTNRDHSVFADTCDCCYIRTDYFSINC